MKYFVFEDDELIGDGILERFSPGLVEVPNEGIVTENI